MKTNAKPEATVLRKPQVRILVALLEAKKPMSRGEISEAAKVDVAWVGDHLGKHEAADRKAREKLTGFASLITLGFVEPITTDSGNVYRLTRVGGNIARAAKKVG